MNSIDLNTLFRIDALAIIMMALVAFIAVTVLSFSARYMKGDRHEKRFFITMAAMAIMVMVMVAANHFVLLLACWVLANVLLVSLMIHKWSWPQAVASGRLAAFNFTLGAICIGAGMIMISTATGQTTVSGIVNQAQTDSPMLTFALVLIILGAMTQSAIWPFHRWLTSSLNAPTPVSAIMHAGLVNSGGFLLARFAPLYLQSPDLLTFIFVVGIATALLGTLWKLIQPDIKRMLACSTMGQMGFMMAQCGLGLFPAAVAHLCWHGLFKAYLFLGSGSAAQEKRMDPGYPPSARAFSLALICGAIGGAIFSAITIKIGHGLDTTLLLSALACIAGTQFALPFFRDKTWGALPLAALFTGGMGALYGLSVQTIALIMAPMNILQPQPLNGFHLAGFGLLIFAWLAMLFGRTWISQAAKQGWFQKLYVQSLNAGQPHPSTITAHRNHYQTL